MRFSVLSLLLLLGGCGANPAAMGLTGAVSPAPIAEPADAGTVLPDDPEAGTQYAPNMPANTGHGKFWGYN